MFKGELTGLREAVQTALTSRFGALDTAAETAIASASRDACLAVLGHFMNETLEQVQVRLAATPQVATPDASEEKDATDVLPDA